VMEASRSIKRIISQNRTAGEIQKKIRFGASRFAASLRRNR
jgi:hypothetical protein